MSSNHYHHPRHTMSSLNLPQGGGPLASSTANQPIPNPQLPISEQLMQLDQAITMTLQEIDQNFATSHQIVTSKILPAIKRYGVASARTWQGAKFWKHFFEVAANVSLSPGASDDATSAYDPSSHSESHTTFTSDGNQPSPSSVSISRDHHGADYDEDDSIFPTITRQQGQVPDDSLLGHEVGDDSDDTVNFYESLKHARASSPPRLSNASLAATARADRQRQTEAVSKDHTWAPMESPFEVLKRNLQGEVGRMEGGMDDSILEHQAKRQAERRGEKVYIDDVTNDETIEIDRRDLTSGVDRLSAGVRVRSAQEGSSSAMEPAPTITSTRLGGGGGRATAKATGSSTPKGKSPLLKKVLNSEQRKKEKDKGFIKPVSSQIPYPRIQTTPRTAAHRNPFAEPASVKHWNGIADLRKTPLNPRAKGKGRSKDGSGGNESDSDSSDGTSITWPSDMSPPVTMQFTVPQSKYAKTPAKEAARMVVDDLLRTVEGASPHVRAMRRAQMQAQADSTSPAPASQPSLAKGTGRFLTTSRTPIGPVGTPLRRGKKEEREYNKVLNHAYHQSHESKRRDSMPTPPTLTRRGPVLNPRTSTTPSAPPSYLTKGAASGGLDSGSRAGSLAPSEGHSGAGGSAAAMLMDEGEGLEYDDSGAGAGVDIGNDSLGHDDQGVAQDLGTKLSSLELGTPGAVNVDRLLDIDVAEDEDSDSGSDPETESEDSEEEDLAAPPVRNEYDSKDINQTLDNSGWTMTTTTNSSSSSKPAGKSIEDDTLFGVPRPLTGGSSSAASSSATTNNPSAFSRLAAEARSRGIGPTLAKASAGVSSEAEFKPWGKVEEAGTIHGGRPLLGRDDTYSAPSPTPMNLKR
ncbi:hypothetical protein IE53DRAFT_387285 [Violaceomyces palustris]|uniref:Uncharacterized protein n=1 Tax=Violaceomyces palustris TaxID=1673888 RepID=A0ACD0NXA7_9BASI|nr:hypothetical protein IE53DRAFT_387285 [Violaceomyces palustris]